MTSSDNSGYPRKSPLAIGINPGGQVIRYPDEARSKLEHSEEIRPVLWYIRDHWRQGDLMYVFSPSEDAFRYYSLLLRADFREVIIGANLREDFENTYRKDLDRLRGRGRVWVLFSHVGGYRGKGVNVERMVGYLETIGKRQDQVRYSGAFAYLFDLTASSEMLKEGNDEETSKTEPLDRVQGGVSKAAPVAAASDSQGITILAAVPGDHAGQHDTSEGSFCGMLRTGKHFKSSPRIVR